MSDDKWLDVVRQKMDNLEASPPDSLFEDIEKELASQANVHRTVSMRRILAYAAAIIALVSIPLTIYFNQGDRNSTQPLAQSRTSAKMQPTSDAQQNEPNAANASNTCSHNTGGQLTAMLGSHPATHAMAGRHAARAVASTAPSATNCSSSNIIEESPNNSHQQQVLATQQEQQPIQTSQQTEAKENTHTKKLTSLPPTNEGELLLAYNDNKHSQKGWSVAVGLGQTAGNVNTSTGVGDEEYANSAEPTYDASAFASMLTVFNSLAYQEKIEYKHRLPVRIGILVSKQLSDRWSISTGIDATYLLSVPKESYLGKDYNQKLYYLGIPVKINYNFINTRHINVYWANGAEAEKCIYAKRAGEKLHIPDIQMSASTALGVQYLITKRLGIYAEPGLTYYWGNGTNVETYRTENPLNMDFHIGLKLNY
jgi:hypothetical protein